MKKIQFQISTDEGEQTATGYALTFEGHNHDFAVHRAKDPGCNECWVVTHLKTGLMIPQQYICTTRVDAIEQATIRMVMVTPSEFDKIIAKHKVIQYQQLAG